MVVECFLICLDFYTGYSTVCFRLFGTIIVCPTGHMEADLPNQLVGKFDGCIYLKGYPRGVTVDWASVSKNDFTVIFQRCAEKYHAWQILTGPILAHRYVLDMAPSL